MFKVTVGNIKKILNVQIYYYVRTLSLWSKIKTGNNIT